MDLAVVFHDDPTDVIRWHADGSHITSDKRTCKHASIKRDWKTNICDHGL